MKVALISDTHGHLDDKLWEYIEPCDEIWHAGDVGSVNVIETLERKKKTRGVYGNIDGQKVRGYFPEYLYFTIHNTSFLLIHIGGYPNRFSPRSRELINELKPDIFICGHSHILKVMRDQKSKMLCLNPGACGVHGFHKVKTMLRFTISELGIKDLEALELGPRSSL